MDRRDDYWSSILTEVFKAYPSVIVGQVGSIFHYGERARGIERVCEIERVAPQWVLSSVLRTILVQSPLGETAGMRQGYFAMGIEKVRSREVVRPFDRYEVRLGKTRRVPDAWTSFAVEVEGEEGMHWSVETTVWLSFGVEGFVLAPFGGRVGELITL